MPLGLPLKQLPFFLLELSHGLRLLLESGVLLVRCCLIRLDLLTRQRQLIPKDTLNRRRRVFEYQVVEFLELVHEAHIVSHPISGKEFLLS